MYQQMFACLKKCNIAKVASLKRGNVPKWTCLKKVAVVK